MDCISKCGRVLIVVLNILFLLVGLVIFGLGMVLKFGFDNVKPYLDQGLDAVKDGLRELKSVSGGLGSGGFGSIDVSQVDKLGHIVEEILSGVAIALIALGSVILILAILGCCGACYKIKIFLYVYSFIIFVLMATLIVLTGLYLNKRDIIDEKVKPILQASLHDSYGGLKGLDFISLAWNFGMQQFSCCGVDSYKDFAKATKWNPTPFPTPPPAGPTLPPLKIPLACCKKLPTGTNPNDLTCATNPNATNSNFGTGCYNVLWSYIEKYNKYVMTFVILLTLIEALIVFLGCWIACNHNKGKVAPSD